MSTSAALPEKHDTPVSEATPVGWNRASHPRVKGMALHEWNIPEGTTWFSDEWRDIILDDYDETVPNNRSWWQDRVPPEDLGKIQRSCLAIHAGFADSAQVMFRLRRKDGSWRTLISHSSVTTRASDGSPLVATGCTIDVTDLADATGAMLNVESLSEFDFQSMLENSPDLFIRFDKKLRPVYVNPPVARFLGGLRNVPSFGQRLAGQYKEVFKKNVERVFSGHKAVHDEIPFIMSDGSEVLGACTFWPEFDAKGELRFAMVQFRDITERRRMEQREQLNERRMAALYELTMMENEPESQVLRFVMDTVLQLSDSRSGFFFIPSEDDPDKGDLLWSDDHYQEFDRRYLPSDHLPHDLKIQLTDEDGNARYRSINNGDGVTPLYIVFGGTMRVMRGITSMVVEDNRVVCIAGVCNKSSAYDKADLKQFETFINSAWLILRRRRSVHELHKAKEKAEIANKTKNAFLANVSHELRTPLNGVLSMLELIGSMSLGQEQREYLKTARDSGKALLSIISDILDYSGMEAGKMHLTLELFDCAAVIRSALGMFPDSAARKGLSFSYRIDPDIPACLLGDEARVRQIIYNLVGNSLKFTPSGGSIHVSCDPAPAPEGKAAVTLQVIDSGIGIPRDKLKSIFDAFVQVDSTHRKQYGGTGLGLSIVKRLVTMMGGTVELESELGKGTMFRCTLYFDIPSETLAVISAAVSDLAPLPGRPLDILVAEDDTVGSMALRVFLQKRGHRVLCVDNGERALEALRAYPFDCLFSDITMPGMDGLELVRRIRSGEDGGILPSAFIRGQIHSIFPQAEDATLPLPARLPVIAVSAHSMLGDKEYFIEEGMDHYISKPINRDELDSALQFVFRQLAQPA